MNSIGVKATAITTLIAIIGVSSISFIAWAKTNYSDETDTIFSWILTGFLGLFLFGVVWVFVYGALDSAKSRSN